MLIDSHCHVDAEYFPEGPDAALDRARERGVHGFVTIGVGETLDQAHRVVELAGRRDDVWAAVGVHPHDAKVLTDDMHAELAELAKRPRVVAVGEIGLDYHYMHSEEHVQREVFRRLIRLARACQLPIVVHTRNAPEQTIEILESEGAREVGGIIHCFSEDRSFARKALDLDFDLSFSGIVTFNKSKSIQDVAAWAPADRILVETDSPYLAPIPKRGKPCEPAYVVHTARKVAELRGASYEDLATQSSDNTRRRLRLS